jgi:hypothetical protein
VFIVYLLVHYNVPVLHVLLVVIGIGIVRYFFRRWRRRLR